MRQEQYSIVFESFPGSFKNEVDVHAQLHAWGRFDENNPDPCPNQEGEFYFSVPRATLALEGADLAEALCIFLADEAMRGVDNGDDWQIIQEMLWNNDPLTRNVLTLSVDGGPPQDLPWPYPEKYVLATVASGLNTISKKLKLMEQVAGQSEEALQSPRRAVPRI